MNCVRINRNGSFYSVSDDGVYIMYYFFSYTIKNNKCGFPKSSYNKVINTLEERKINYEVVDEKVINDFKKLNNFVKYKELGFKKYNKDIHFVNLIDKIKTLDEEKLNKILEIIEDIANE